MNKKLIYTGILLCVGGLGLTNSAWAHSDSANGQSVKKCTFEAEDADVVLTRQFPNGHVNEADPLDPDDDFYEICHNPGFTDCQLAVPAPIPTPIENGGVIVGYTGLTIIGTNKTNVIEGTRGDDEICGQNGNDRIDGLEGNDTIHGNNGNDILIGGPGDDQTYGGNGNDLLFGYDEDESNDPLEGGDFDLDGDVDAFDTDVDSIEGGNGKDVLSGGPNHDDLDGGNGKDYLNGGEGVDVIDGGNGKNTCADSDLNDCPVVETKGSKGKRGKKGGKK
ncbi:MAG: hypothetical protein LUQ57_03205 [Methylococcaceae bacterium]|nr:hypothetical protein [Methylococcaceae bacterium]